MTRATELGAGPAAEMDRVLHAPRSAPAQRGPRARPKALLERRSRPDAYDKPTASAAELAPAGRELPLGAARRSPGSPRSSTRCARGSRRRDPRWSTTAADAERGERDQRRGPASRPAARSTKPIPPRALDRLTRPGPRQRRLPEGALAPSRSPRTGARGRSAFTRHRTAPPLPGADDGDPEIRRGPLRPRSTGWQAAELRRRRRRAWP